MLKKLLDWLCRLGLHPSMTAIDIAHYRCDHCKEVIYHNPYMDV